MPESTSPRAGGPPAAQPEFPVLAEYRKQGIIRRFYTTQRHLYGLILGALIALRRDFKHQGRGRGTVYRLLAIAATLVNPFVDARYRVLPFAVQLRRRLEALGPTYVKLGQVMSLREDILPIAVTEELKNLLDRLPAVSIERFCAEIEKDLGRPVSSMFATIDERPLGSASIAQVHRATTLEGEDVIIKVVKPGIPEVLRRDAILLRVSGRLLQIFFSRFQPKRIINEFVEYTLREVDLTREADNAETFTANFEDREDIVFPSILRQYSGRRVLTMTFLDGLKPDDPVIEMMSEREKNHLIDVGAAAILRMIYKDGFFHADLHPGNLLILERDEKGLPRVGFIDLGMVGRLDEQLRRTLLYYYFSLVMGDAENAARYLLNAAEIGPGSDPHGFRREAEEIARRWRLHANFEGYSIGHMILRSVALGAQFRVYFPVELVLMVKALVTYEGVGQILKPNFDVASASSAHIRSLFLEQFNPLRLMREGIRGAPEIVDALVKAPLLVTEGLRVLEKTTRKPPENPLAGLRGTVMAAAALVAGAIIVATGGPWPAWVILFLLALILGLRRGG